jgi:hypothetical protein
VTGDAAYWDSQAPTFDHQPDHGLRDKDVQEAWQRLLLANLPPPRSPRGCACRGLAARSCLSRAGGTLAQGLPQPTQSRPSAGTAPRRR